MDRISGLSDDLLIKILLFLPTKVVVSTSVLSKRWEFLWMWLPKLRFVGRFFSLNEYQRLGRFLDRNMPFYRAPVIESFRLKLFGPGCKPKYIKMCVLIAISLYIRELEISLSYAELYNSNVLPSSLYNCKSLVTLKLEGDIILDVPRSRMVGLPCLKILQLRRLRHLNGSLQRLLSICPVLEDLLVRCDRLNFETELLTVNVPSLQSLSIYIPLDIHGIFDGLVINTPSLKYLKLEDLYERGHSCFIENMPTLREAYVDTNFHDILSLIGSITSVKRLTFSSQAHVFNEPAQVYGAGFVFNQLEHLKICLGNDYSSSLFVRLLEDSPNLRVLDIFKTDYKYGPKVCWNQPGTVPKCIVSTLQTFKWSGYLGRPHERDIAVYILTNACRLKTATISFDDRYVGTKLEMIKELSLSSRASTTCQLVFD